MIKKPITKWSRAHYNTLDGKVGKLQVAIHDLLKIGELRDLDVVEQARFKALQGCLSLDD